MVMSIVKEVIDNWDPISLLSHAPKDEYHSEIKEIEELLKTTADCAELATGIYDIFLKSFGNVSFQKTHSDCVQVANKLLSCEQNLL